MDQKPQKCHLRWASFAIEVLFWPKTRFTSGPNRRILPAQTKPETQSFEMKNEPLLLQSNKPITEKETTLVVDLK